MGHSIFLKITLFFLITFIAMGIGFNALYNQLNRDYEQRLQSEAQALLLLLRQSIFLPVPMRKTFLVEHGYEMTTPSPKLINTLQNAFTLIPKNYPEEIQDSMKEGRIRILKDDHNLYVYLTKATPPYLVIKPSVAEKTFWSEAIFVILLFSLVLFYLLIIKTLFPLKKLIHTIEQYGKEGEYRPIKTLKKDEIAQVSNALDAAMHKNKSLMEARRLFLRNIMHELKTPITVGKLSLPFLKKGEEKSILERAFFRMEHLIQELVRVEQITSGMIAPEPKECDPIVLIHKAASLLFIEIDTLEITSDGGLIEVDCDIFVTVFKNFIDNALKYSPDNKVRILHEKGTITFINRGDPWPDDRTLESLTEPFSQNQSTQQGFGLGLYIIKSILDAHSLHLSHQFVSGEHFFSVHFQHD
ncbi:MAG: HAMP domain-containing histidine kinase [Sulfuricurvum sp.]|nr:HAMP domain-containing histidine kinase [Sulfuricurvum sp.]